MANATVNNNNNMVFMAVENSPKSKVLTEHTWIADSGATCHITNLLEGMFDVCDIKESVTIGTGRVTYATKCGKCCGKFHTPEGKREVILSEVRYVPGFYVKLFSVTRAMKNGARAISEGTRMTVGNGPIKLVFENCLETGSSFVLGLKLRPISKQMAAYAVRNVNNSVREWHGQLGHISNNIMQRTATYYGKRIREKSENCEDCVMGKAKQTNMNKDQVE